jgi:cytochrome P450
MTADAALGLDRLCGLQVHDRRGQRMSRLPPGPRDALFGLRLGNRFRRNPLKFLNDLVREHGDLAMFRLGPYRACLVNYPDLIRDVLVTYRAALPKLARHRRTIRSFSGDNLFVSEGENWLRQRRIVQPAFQSRFFDSYVDAVAKHALRWRQGWDDGTEIDLVPEMARLSLLTIGQSLFHTDLSDEVENCGQALRIHSETLRDEFRSLIVLPDWLPTAAKRRKRWAKHYLRELITRLIRQRRDVPSERMDALSVLVRATENGTDDRISEQRLIDEATILFVAGQDDITAALCWCWCLLAQHADTEARFRAEIQTVLGGRMPVYADVAQLPFTEMIIKETLRMYPPTWTLVPRCATEELTLGGYRIPRGTWVFVSPYATHHDPRFFPNPERFDPDRFSDERQPEIAPFTYLPFGAGPRSCIGNHFSLTLLTIALVVIAQRFRMTLQHDPAKLVPDPSLALRPRRAVMVRLH